jgi:hypothetical protein
VAIIKLTHVTDKDLITNLATIINETLTETWFIFIFGSIAALPQFFITVGKKLVDSTRSTRPSRDNSKGTPFQSQTPHESGLEEHPVGRRSSQDRKDASGSLRHNSEEQMVHPQSFVGHRRIGDV